MMNTNTMNRRTMVKNVCWTAGMLLTGTGSGHAAKGNKMHLASNQYSWYTYWQREGRDFNASLDEGLKDLAASGLDGYETNIETPDQIGELTPLLKKHGLEMRSLYVNSLLHDREQAGKSIEHILAIAKKAKGIGTRIVVTNPSPIRWGGPEDKNDGQLEVQAKALNELGRELSDMGLILAYHNHDAEMRNAAREFHHMIAGTDPRYVTLCLDSHWIYRGAGNSSVALFDIVKLYGSRISELHFRQSIDGVWSETFEEGDIDYARLAETLKRIGVKPHLVLEQAIEKGTPKTMDPVTAHRKSDAYTRRVFAGF